MDWEFENTLRCREGTRHRGFPTLRSNNMIEKTFSDVAKSRFQNSWSWKRTLAICTKPLARQGFAPLRFVPDSLTGLRGLISARWCVVLQHADSSPRLVGLAASRIGEKRQQPHPKRQALQLRRGMQQRTRLDRLPPVWGKEFRPFPRREFQRRTGINQRATNGLLEHLEKRR